MTTTLDQYDTDFLRILKLIATFPGIKTGGLADKTGKSPSTILRATEILANDGWIKRDENNREEFKGLRAPYSYFPRARLHLVDVDVVLVRRLKQQRNQEQVQEHYTLLETLQGSTTARASLEQIALNLRSAASAIVVMSTEVLKLENHFGDLPDNRRNP